MFGKTILFLVLVFNITPALALHIKGGWIQYEYLGPGLDANTSKYRITTHLFVSCTEFGPTATVYVSIFSFPSQSPVFSQQIPTDSFRNITKTTYDPCLSNRPNVCYNVYNYSIEVQLRNNPQGYTITVQDALRSSNIINIVNSNQTGITFTADIPADKNGSSFYTNNSPIYKFTDTVLICYNSPFEYQFSASDPDGDSLSYGFGNGLDVTNPNGQTSINPPAPPPYFPVVYRQGYSGSNPMGTNIQINPATGLITGQAPATTGEYVLAVYVKEWRNGQVIASTKKELQVSVASCSFTSATLKPEYINCKSFDFNFRNESSASNITGYFWDFGVTSSSRDTSSFPVPFFTYPDTGTYELKLKVINSGGCADSTTAQVKVYPGFTPDFNYSGSCYASPFNFNDATGVSYGRVSSWRWDFGDYSTSADTSTIKAPSYRYADPAQRTVSLIVQSSKGCVDSISKTITVDTKPLIDLPFRDTLICSIDTLQLIANTIDDVVWKLNYNISDLTAKRPLVWPERTTTYTVTVTKEQCSNQDSIRVRVLDFITVDAGADTAICATDFIQLNAVSEGLKFNWTPAVSLATPDRKTTAAQPLSTTTYYVNATLGKCQARDSLTVFVAPYPLVDAGNDTTICFGTTAQLHGESNADHYNWEPADLVSYSNILNPVAAPSQSTLYILTVYNDGYCSKPVSDTMVVAVLPKINLYAGADTNVVIGQSLQLTASGATSYEWTPSYLLNNSTSNSPIVNLDLVEDSIRFLVTGYLDNGCSETDDVLVRKFTTSPSIFVPSAFTPNNDGKNDVIKPIVAGIKKLNYFRIYNRYGQLVFQTSNPENGWDGKVNGMTSPMGTFVYAAAGIDYQDRQISARGTIVLLR